MSWGALRRRVAFNFLPDTDELRRPDSPPSCAPKPIAGHRVPHYLETAGDPQFDYGVDDPSLPEQPDAGVQEPDATFDDDSYYAGGAYYYVQPVDDDHE